MDEGTLFLRIGKWLRHAPLQMSVEPAEETRAADAAQTAGGAHAAVGANTPEETRTAQGEPAAEGEHTVEVPTTFLRPWAKRDAAIQHLQEGFVTLTDLMGAIRDNLERQNRKQDAIVAVLRHRTLRSRTEGALDAQYVLLVADLMEYIADRTSENERLQREIERLKRESEQLKQNLLEARPHSDIRSSSIGESDALERASSKPRAKVKSTKKRRTTATLTRRKHFDSSISSESAEASDEMKASPRTDSANSEESLPLVAELRTYRNRLSELLPHEGEYVLIKAEEVGGIFPTYAEAIDVGYQQFGFSPFLVRKIEREDHVVRLSRHVLSSGR
jgi:hypothetical protein